MEKIILHIGHGKTGTSYIQSALSLNKDYLRDKGINYPANKSFKQAFQGLPTSGNGDLFLKKNFRFNNTVLFSDEGLHDRLLMGDNFEKLFLRHDLDSIKVILYSRNLLELQYSAYLQWLQTGLGASDFNEYVSLYPPPYKQVLDWLKKSNDIGFNLVFRNYSNYKNTLLKRFFSDLLGDIDFSDINIPEIHKINRSLNISEASLCSVLYSRLGADSKYFANQFITNFPNMQNQKIKISENTYNYLLSQYKGIVSEINSIVNINEHISIEEFDVYNKNAIDPDPTSFCILSKKHCDILAKALVEYSSPRNFLTRKFNNYLSTIKFIIKKIM